MLFYTLLSVMKTHAESLNDFLLKAVIKLIYKSKPIWKNINIKRVNHIGQNKNKYTGPHNMLLFKCISNYYRLKILNPKEVPKGSFCKSFCFYGIQK